MSSFLRRIGNPRVRGGAWELFLCALVLLMLSYSWMFAEVSVPNERSRLYLSVALVDHQTIRVDAPVERFGEIYDLAQREGHYYSDKAPGSSFVGAVVYGGARLFTEPAEWTQQELLHLMRNWLMIPLGLVGFLVMRRLLRRYRITAPVIDLVSMGWILGTSAFHYSTAFVGHQIVAVSLLGAMLLVKDAEDDLREGREPAATRRALLAGLLCGVAGLTEYQAAIPCVLFALWLVAGPARRHRRVVAAFFAAAAPLALLLFAYNQAAFGGPFELSYHHLANPEVRDLHREGIAGVTVPTWEYFRGAMFSLHRGLFTTSPMFLLLPLGLWTLWRRPNRRDAALLGLTFLYFVAFISSSNVWHAGWTFGPRLLVPGMGLFALLVAIGTQRVFDSRVVQGIPRGLILCGVLLHQLVHAFFPEAPESSKNPVMDVVIPMLEAGQTTPNIVEANSDLDGLLALVPLACAGGVIAVVILVRGARNQSVSDRVVSTVIALLVVAGFAGLVVGVADHWEPKQKKKWMKNVEFWDLREKKTRDEADAARRMIQEM